MKKYTSTSRSVFCVSHFYTVVRCRVDTRMHLASIHHFWLYAKLPSRDLDAQTNLYPAYVGEFKVALLHNAS